MRSILKYVVVMCLLLTVWSAVAVVAHHHADGTESAKCTVCIAAHSSAPKSTAGAQHLTFTPVFTLTAEPVSAHGHLVVFALSIRPPPTA